MINRPPAESTTLDMRYNALESIEDFLLLVNREHEKNHFIDTVMITPDQADDLTNLAKEFGGVAGPIKTLYGYKIFTREMD